MVEPTSASLAALTAALSAVTMAMFGVDYYSLLWGLVGAMFAASFAGSMGSGRAILYVLLSTLTGAVLGNLVTAYFQLQNRIVLIGLCLVGGLIAQAVATAIFKAAPGLTAIAVRGIESMLKRMFGAAGSGGKP